MPFVFNRGALLRTVREGVTTGLEEIMVRVQREIRVELSKPGKGRTYRIGKGKASGRNKREKGFHRASAPGHPPAADTGTLRRSWQVGGTRNVVDRRRLRHPIRPAISLGSAVKYASWLQYGTKRMAARPYVVAPLERVRKHAHRIIDKHISKALSAKVKK